MVSPPPKYAFHDGQILWRKFIGGLFCMGGLMIISYQGEGVSQNALSKNPNTVNLEIFPNRSGIFT